MAEAILSYKKRNSLIHKTPAIIKLVVLFCIPLILHLTDWPCHVALFVLAFILSFIAKISTRDFFRDLRPIFYYCLIIALIDIFSTLLFDKTPMLISGNIQDASIQSIQDLSIQGADLSSTNISNSKFSSAALQKISSFLNNLKAFFSVVLANGNYMLLSRLVVAMTYTSIFFRTTSHREIREALEKIELGVTFGHAKLTFSKAFALFLNFLPQLFSIWASLDKAWRARQGKRGIRKILVLMPVFISLSIKKANDTLLSIKNRFLAEP